MIDLIVKKKKVKIYYLDLKGHLCRYRCLIWIHGQIMDGWVDGGGGADLILNFCQIYTS